MARLRRALELADPASESVMETQLRLLLVLSGLPRLRTQVSLFDETGAFIARPDLYYPDKRLALEHDGVSHRDNLAADNRRQNRLARVRVQALALHRGGCVAYTRRGG